MSRWNSDWGYVTSDQMLSDKRATPYNLNTEFPSKSYISEQYWKNHYAMSSSQSKYWSTAVYISISLSTVLLFLLLYYFWWDSNLFTIHFYSVYITKGISFNKCIHVYKSLQYIVFPYGEWISIILHIIVSRGSSYFIVLHWTLRVQNITHSF